MFRPHRSSLVKHHVEIILFSHFNHELFQLFTDLGQNIKFKLRKTAVI